MTRWKTKRTQRRRWQVERVRYRCWITGGIIFGEGWQVTAPDGYVIHTECTWCEAMKYADTQARTVTVTLPRVDGRTKLTAHNGIPGGHPTGYKLIPRDKEHYCAITILGPWGRAGIFDAQDLEPLALALLAHYYKQEAQK